MTNPLITMRQQAESLAMLLEGGGYVTRLAHNGEMALSIAAKFLPDFALLDIGLPGISGYDVAKCIRQLPGLESIFLIAQTGWARERDRQLSRDAGFDAHLIKPLDLQLLEKILRRNS
jgi:CheY-like chemotaxis protein